MNIAYKRELAHNYLIIRRQCSTDNYQIYMVTENRLPGLLPCRTNRIDEEIHFLYDITSRQNLSLFLERKRLSCKELVHFLEQLKETLNALKEYLLHESGLLLKPEQIYLDADSEEIFFCYVPGYEGQIRESFLELTEFLLGRLDRQDKQGIAFGYELFKLAGEENCSLDQILAKRPEQEEETERKEIQQEKCSTGKAGQAKRPEKAEIKETGILEHGKPEQWVLYSSDPNYEDLVIQGESYLIGKKKHAVDGVIRSRTVSRIHSRITKKEGKYYISDLNSTNGTYLNGSQLEVNETAELHLGDCVGMADVEFVVGTKEKEQDLALKREIL